MIVSYLIQFFVFSFLGWIIDSSFCSLVNKKVVISGYFRRVPLCPIYGFGGILLLNTFVLMNCRPDWMVVTVTTFLVVALEYVGGYVAEHFLDEKLWDYSNDPINLNGYIGGVHSVLWLGLVGIIYKVSGPWAVHTVGTLNKEVMLSAEWNVLISFIMVLLALRLTLSTKKRRLLEVKTKQK